LSSGVEPPVAFIAGPTTPSAFICHSTLDKPFVLRLCEELKKKQIRVWLDEEQILVGHDFVERMEEGITASDFTAVVVSPRFVAHGLWAKEEYRTAVTRQVAAKRVVLLPVLLEACEILQLLNSKKYADFTGSYDWPVGFHVGLDLNKFWKLEEHKLGETTFTHFADGTAHKNRMQGNDFVTSLMYTHGITCFSCHDVHGTSNNADLLKPANVMCRECHVPNSPNGPRAATIEQHTHHKPGSSSNECVGCHMPKIEQTIADVNVRSHTFKFISPDATETLKIPNSCNSCHVDKTTQLGERRAQIVARVLTVAGGTIAVCDCSTTATPPSDVRHDRGV